jgi:hypothetical protein
VTIEVFQGLLDFFTPPPPPTAAPGGPSALAVTPREAVLIAPLPAIESAAANEIVFERSTKAKNYRLTLRKDGVAVATIPARGTERDARVFVAQHADWLARARERQSRKPRAARVWALGTQVLWRGELREVRRAGRDARARLDDAEKVQAKTPRKIGPGVVVGDERAALPGCKKGRPLGPLPVEALEEGEAVGLIALRVRRIQAHQGLEDRAGDHLGVRRVEPVVRIAAAVRVAVAGPDAPGTDIEQCDIGRRIDMASAAPLQFAVAGLLEQPVQPQVVVNAHAQHHPGTLEQRQVLWAGLETLGVLPGRDEVGRVNRESAVVNRILSKPSPIIKLKMLYIGS